MAIVNMKKLTLAAPQGEKNEVLNLIQSMGCVHIVDLKEELVEPGEDVYFYEHKVLSQAETDYSHVKFAYEFLKGYSDEKKGMFSKRDVISKDEFQALGAKVNWHDIYNQCREISGALDAGRNKETRLNATMHQYTVWRNLDVSDSDLKGLKSTAYFIGTVSRKYEQQLYDDLGNLSAGVYVEIVSDSFQDINLFLLCHREVYSDVSDLLKKYGFSKASIDLSSAPKDVLSSIDAELETIRDRQSELEQKARELSSSIADIEKVYDYLSNKVEKEDALTKLLNTHKTFILEGWLPEDRVSDAEKVLKSNVKDLYMNFTEPTEDDEIPVALKNNAFSEPFEVITSMYSLPQHSEIDPTPLIAPFFMLFFGMMMADMGYGLLMLIGPVLALKFMDLNDSTRKMVKLILYCSVPTILFGWLYGSFFGGIIEITPLWVDPVENTMSVLYFSLALGLFHLFFGLGIKGYMLIKSGKVLDAVYDVLFWYALLAGLVWLLLGGGTAAKIISAVGAIGLVLTQGRANKTIVGKFFGGLYGLYGITGYLGDTLSYSRLLALGLASGLIGWAFNLLIELLGSGPVVYIAGPIIFIAGHMFNFLVGGLGTFVHTCRLQYLEFFGKFYEGGGKAFTPLTINTKFIKVKSE